MAGLLDFDPAIVPWPYVLALASLGLIYGLYRKRADAFEEIGFSSKEVALLCLGSIAGWSVNVPLVPLGNSYLFVNLGGALVPLLIVAWWLRKGKLNVLRAMFGTAIVAVVANRVSRFEPEVGVIAVYPYFFLPALVALVYAIALHPRQPLRSVPVAYASGSIGALLGADVFNLPKLSAHYGQTVESAAISIGGAGVFDMVFLAGTLAMAVDVAVVVALHRTRLDADPFATYPGRAYEVRDSRRAWDQFVRLPDPSPLERAVGAVALSNEALLAGDYARSVRMSKIATDEALGVDAGLASLATAGRGPLARDVRILISVGARATEGAGGSVTRREAGEANDTAKLILGAVATVGAGRNRLEGL